MISVHPKSSEILSGYFWGILFSWADLQSLVWKFFNRIYWIHFPFSKLFRFDFNQNFLILTGNTFESFAGILSLHIFTVKHFSLSAQYIIKHVVWLLYKIISYFSLMFFCPRTQRNLLSVFCEVSGRFWQKDAWGGHAGLMALGGGCFCPGRRSVPASERLPVSALWLEPVGSSSLCVFNPTWHHRPSGSSFTCPMALDVWLQQLS